MSAAAPSPAPAQSKAWLWVLLGCGGCIFVAGVTAIVLVVLAGGATTATLKGARSAAVEARLTAQGAELEASIDDEDRRKRISSDWHDLAAAAARGKVSSADAEALQKKIEDAIADGTLSNDEADALAADAESRLGR